MWSRLFRRKPPLVPDPGQHVRLRLRHGWLQGEYRAISGPISGEGGEVMVRVAEEREYIKAYWEGRPAVGDLWPLKQMEVIMPRSWRRGLLGSLPLPPAAPPTEDDRG
ncbi:MAG TPA: hypothetical protein VE288_11305 [Rubrobacteraceae bacterium]|nr:hypothetical protein [Rubrobacteraceae bacterium]